MKKIISLIIVCTIIISGMFIYKKSDEKTFTNDSGVIIAAVIDGKVSTTFPTTNMYSASIACTKDGKKLDVGAKIVWDGSKWVVSVDDISTSNVRCSANFETPATFKETILANNEVKAPITTPGVAISTSDEALLASTEDDYGTSYYFRGAVTNNYVEFANKCWRIVRIVGDGSIKLVLHNDNTSGVSNPCSPSNNNDTAAFAHYNGSTYTSEFNPDGESNAYIGFMYGKPYSDDYASEHANTTKSTVLTNLETWYKNNLLLYESNLADTIWCNDKSLVSGVGHSMNTSTYGAYNRLISLKAPSLICPTDGNVGKLSKFTVSDTINGNGNLTYKVGLLTADELVFAGYIADDTNSSVYLLENADYYLWWTMSPYYYLIGDNYSWVWSIHSKYFKNYFVNGTAGAIRPSISLISTIIATGTGTSSDPYVIN